jgi:hypothetical protein
MVFVAKTVDPFLITVWSAQARIKGHDQGSDEPELRRRRVHPESPGLEE